MTTREAIAAHLNTVGHTVDNDGTGLAVTGLIVCLTAFVMFVAILATTDHESGRSRRTGRRPTVLKALTAVCALSGIILIGRADVVASSHWIQGAPDQVQDRTAVRMMASAQDDLTGRYTIARVSNTEMIPVVPKTSPPNGCRHLGYSLLGRCIIEPWNTDDPDSSPVDLLDGLVSDERTSKGPFSAAVTTDDRRTLLYRVGLDRQGRLVLIEALDGAPGPNRLLR